MEKRDRQWSRKSWSGCPLRPCSWWCLGGPSRVTKCRWTLWSVRASSWGSWLYSSSNTKYRLTMTSITDQPREASHCKTASVAVLSAPANAVETLMADQTKCGNQADRGRRSFAGIRASESEPWTSFYMAGEVIRALRKAHENKQVSVAATKDDMRKAA